MRTQYSHTYAHSRERLQPSWPSPAPPPQRHYCNGYCAKGYEEAGEAAVLRRVSEINGYYFTVITAHTPNNSQEGAYVSADVTSVEHTHLRFCPAVRYDYLRIVELEVPASRVLAVSGDSAATLAYYFHYMVCMCVCVCFMSSN